MKKILAGMICLVMVYSTTRVMAAFPSFIASAVWSSDLIPDPDYIDAVDADFFAAADSYSAPDSITSPNLIVADEEMDTVVPEEVSVVMMPVEVPAEDMDDDEAVENTMMDEEILIFTPDEVIDEDVIATPDEVVIKEAEREKAVINTEGEPEGAIQ